MKYELQTLEEYSDEAILSELRRVAKTLNGKRLTQKLFDSLARVHSSTIRNRFGSWANALDKAGISESIAPRYRVLTRQEIVQAIHDYARENPGIAVTQNNIARYLGFSKSSIQKHSKSWETIIKEIGLNLVPGTRRYSDDECYENILVLWTHYGRQPHFAELNKPPSSVGSKAYISRWGGWRAALTAFVKKVNESDVPPDQDEIIESNIEIQLNNETPSPVSRSIPLAIRYKVLSRDKFRCVLCGASPAKDVTVELHIDHVYPFSRGGKNSEENLRTLCLECNLGKGCKIEK